MPALQPAHSPHVGRFTLTDDSSSAMEFYHHKPKTQIGFCGGQESEVDTSGTVSDYTNGKVAIKDQEQTGHDLQTNLHVSFEGNFLPSLTDDSSSAMEIYHHKPKTQIGFCGGQESEVDSPAPTPLAFQLLASCQ